MKVNGQLEVAQLEQIANAAPTPTPTGRIYIDITVPTAAVPRFYNGAAWVPFATGQTSPTISQNSGLAVSVNWALGLNQMVILTNNCVISFQNPVPGATHNLIVQQANATSYRYTLNMIDQATKRQPYQPIGIIPQNANASYSWFYQAGVQAASPTMGGPYTVPQSLPPTAMNCFDLSSDGKTFLGSRTTTPYWFTYDVTDAWAQAVAPWGLQNITTPPAATTPVASLTGIKYFPDGKSVLAANSNTPFIQIFQTNRGTPVSAFSGPSSTPTGGVLCAAIHPSGYFTVVGHATTPFMTAHQYAGSGFGGKISNPATLPAAAVAGIAWSPQGDYLTTLSGTTPFIQTWAFSYTGTAGAFGAVSANPSTLPTGGNTGLFGSQVAWRPQGDWIACALNVSPFLYVVPFNRATGTYGTPLTVTALSATAQVVAWSPDGQYLLVGTTTAPFLYIFDFSSQNLSIPVTVSVGAIQINDIYIHPNGETFFLALNTTPFIAAYPMPTKVRNYLRISGP